MAIHPDGPAPYAPAPAVLGVIDGFRNRGLATPFTVAVLERAGVSSSLAPRTLQALKQLDLIDDDGNPTAALSDLAKAGSEEFVQRLAAVVRGAYEDVFQFTEPRDDPPEKVRDAFRHYKPRGQQERMVTLFLGLCEAAGIIENVPKRKSGPSPTRKAPRAQTPQTVRVGQVVETNTAQPIRAEGGAPTSAPPSGQHPFIRGLLQTLPDVGAAWPSADREKWTAAAMAVFDLMYVLPPDDREGGESH